MAVPAIGAEPLAAELSAFANSIDRRIEAKWAGEKVEPAELCSDAEFARRVYLDLLGRIPRVAEIRRFLARPQTETKRAELVAELLARPAFPAHLATTLRGILLPRTNENPELYHLGLSFEAWLRPQLKPEGRYDALVKNLLTIPTRDRTEQGQLTETGREFAGAIAFYEINEFKPQNLAAGATRVLLGVRLECAQCHDHPFDSWSQDQFWQTAAFFTQAAAIQPISREQKLAAVGIEIPQTDHRVEAMLLDGVRPALKQADLRPALAEWIASAENPFFAKHICNRLWAVLMGRGLVEPVDDFRPDNPASHPELLNDLAEGLVAHEFDLRFLIAGILSSNAYQRSSRVTHPSQQIPDHFARMVERPLSAEQLWDSLTTATGYQNAVPLTHRSLVGLSRDTPRGEFLLTFLGTVNPESPQMSLTHALKLMQGEFLTRMTDPKQGPLLGAVAKAPFFTTQDQIETLFLATLSRQPSEAESQRLLTYVEGGVSEDKPRRLGNVLWSLLNSSEFLLNR